MTEQDRKLISFDWAIKNVLRSKANFEVLEGFLSELLFDDIKILEVLESESNKENTKDKYNRLDIKVKNNKGEIVIIEVQFDTYSDFFQRIIYSASKTVCEHICEGDRYDKVVKVISVNIVYFDLGEGKDYIYRGTTQFRGLHANELLKLSPEQRNTLQKDYPSELFPEFYIIKVNNFDNVAETPLDQWVYFLKNSAIRKSFNAKGLAKAGEVLDMLNMTKEERIIYDRFVDSKRLMDDKIATATRNGKIEGIEEERLRQEELRQQEEARHKAELEKEQSKHKVELEQKDAELEQKDAELEQEQAKHKVELEQKDAELEQKDAELEKLRQLLKANGILS